MIPVKNVFHISRLKKLDPEIVGKKAYIFSELLRLNIAIADGFVIKSENLSDKLALDIHEHYKKLNHFFTDSVVDIFTSSPTDHKSLHFYSVKGDANLIQKVKAIFQNSEHSNSLIIVQKRFLPKHYKKFTTNDKSLDKDLQEIAKKIQKHLYFPYDITFVKQKGEIIITGISPYTGSVTKNYTQPKSQTQRKNLKKGIPVIAGIVTGPAKIITGNKFHFSSDEIAVVKNIESEELKKFRKAKGLVIDTFSSEEKDKAVLRQHIQSPTIINTENLASVIKNGSVITLNSVKNEIYLGGPN
jgi:phosphoenolpyruvate synthase/pyruvate phosphate dikinase